MTRNWPIDSSSQATGHEMDWSNVEVVSWDLDGTLYETAPFWGAFRTLVWKSPTRIVHTHTPGTAVVTSIPAMDCKTRLRGGVLGEVPDALQGPEADAVIDRWLSGAIRRSGAAVGVRNSFNSWLHEAFDRWSVRIFGVWARWMPWRYRKGLKPSLKGNDWV